MTAGPPPIPTRSTNRKGKDVGQMQPQDFKASPVHRCSKVKSWLLVICPTLWTTVLKRQFPWLLKVMSIV